MKPLLFLIIILLAGCSTSQFTYYSTSEEEEPWRISVEKNPWESFACVINDSTVIEETFPVFGFTYDTFEKDGMYEGKNIKMSGFRITHFDTNPDGSTKTINIYQIRVFINREEIAIFDF
ncbi:MAG TPA: hypothetical protein VI362_08320 [Ignavibacteriaceae bacterium]|nr:hypothetical protein [Ignavibacteriaceae bacterium]